MLLYYANAHPNRLQSFEHAYMFKAVSRMNDPIHLVFSPGSTQAPTKDEVAAIIKSIQTELSVTGTDEHFAHAIAKGVASVRIVR